MLFFGKKRPSQRMSHQPTAPVHQKPVIDPKSRKRHQKWEEQRIREREQSLRGRKVGLYVHIPFCKSKCAYCDFYSLPGHEARMDAYYRALAANLQEMVPHLTPYVVDTVYIGGGTPSFFGEKRLAELGKLINKNFNLSDTCEFTVECNPESVTPGLVKALRKMGVNRVSLGMQSAQADELKLMGRPHTAEQVGEAVRLLRNKKMQNLSLDLIFGLPLQSMEDWKANVEAALALEPEHLSMYALTVEESTPLGRMVAADRVTLPDDDDLADRYLWAVERLEQAGYHQYEISNFAKDGCESRHNLKYWKGEEYVGFGPSAHSDFGGCRYSYVKDLEEYISGMTTGKPIVAELEQIMPVERAREYLIFRLRTTEGIRGDEFLSRYRCSFTPIEEKLTEYASHGWAVNDGGRWHLTPEGFLLSNQLIGGVLDVLEELMRQTADFGRGY